MLGQGGEGSLVRRAQRGDRGAFDEIVRLHTDRVYAVALRITRNPSDAEDVLQETFLNAYRALDRFGGRSTVSTWLHRIAANAALDVVARRRAARSLDDGTMPEASSTSDLFVASAQRQALEAALAALADEFREAVVLSDIAGLGTTEIAELLSIPPGTAKSRVFRARAQLAELLREPATIDAVEGRG
jgi:RNA polymerase sigma-70 factor (ECF subfamily)